jgi:hypothetical protein
MSESKGDTQASDSKTAANAVAPALPAATPAASTVAETKPISKNEGDDTGGSTTNGSATTEGVDPKPASDPGLPVVKDYSFVGPVFTIGPIHIGGCTLGVLG